MLQDVSQEINLQSTYPWIDIDLFQRVLAKDFPNNSIQIKSYHIKPALAKGKNFTSQMCRAFISYTTITSDSNDGDKSDLHEIRYIIKAGHSDLKQRAIFNEMNMFRREIIIYEHILPEVYKLLDSIGDETKLSPKYYESSLENSYIIFEDLSMGNYTTTEKGFTMEEYKLIVKKLAKWHAATAVLKTKGFKYFDEFTDHQMYINDLFKRLGLTVLKVITDVTKKMTGFNEITQKLIELHSTYHDKIAASVKSNDTDCFDTLCHADLWCNNVMLRNDNNAKPNDALFIDYQVCFVGPAVTDLANVFYLSPHHDLRADDFDTLTKFYHNELRETLTKLNYPIAMMPTLNDINLQMKKRSVAHVVMSLCGKGSIGYDDNGEMDEAITKNEGNDPGKGLREFMLKNANSNEIFKYYLKYFNERGYFD